jgi:hypothetical protein
MRSKASGVQRQGGGSRRDAVAEAVQSLGGLETFYFAFGDRDA